MIFDGLVNHIKRMKPFFKQKSRLLPKSEDPVFEMQALSLIRRCLVIVGLCLKSKTNPHHGYILNWIIMSLLTGFLMITLEFILTHFDDHEDLLYAIMQFVTFVTVWTCYVCFAKQKSKAFRFLEELQEIVDKYCKFMFMIWYYFEIRSWVYSGI